MYKVLIVYGFERFADVFAQRLGLDGYESLKAYNGRQGMETAQSEMPDLIITDRELPGMNGYEMARRLKSARKTRHIPIIGIMGSFSQKEQKILDGFVSTEEIAKDGLGPVYEKMKDLLKDS